MTLEPTATTYPETPPDAVLLAPLRKAVIEMLEQPTDANTHPADMQAEVGRWYMGHVYTEQFSPTGFDMNKYRDVANEFVELLIQAKEKSTYNHPTKGVIRVIVPTGIDDERVGAADVYVAPAESGPRPFRLRTPMLSNVEYEPDGKIKVTPHESVKDERTPAKNAEVDRQTTADAADPTAPPWSTAAPCTP